MKFKKLFSSITVSALLFSLLTGCGNTQSTASQSDASSTAPAKESSAAEASADTASDSGYQTTYGDKQFDNVTIKVQLPDRSNAPEGTTVTENKWVDYIKEEMAKVGINVEFVAIPRSDADAKIQTMMATDSAPDIMISYSYAMAQGFYEDGGTWDLSEFIDGENQARNLKAYIGEEVLESSRNDDGSLYGVMARRSTTALNNFYIRKDWLDALGLSVPKTLDEYYNAIDKMVHENPDGLTNVIGYHGLAAYTLRYVFSSLGDTTQMQIADGYEWYYDPGFKDYYQFLNKMYNNGLMDPEYYVLTEDDVKSTLVNGNLASFEANVNYSVDNLRGNLMQTMQKSNPDAEYVSFTLDNVNDSQIYSPAYSPTGLVIFCPKTTSAETVEACMTYLDWLSTRDGGFVLYHGFEGEHFNYNEDHVPVVIDASYNATDKDWIRTDLFIVGNQGYFETVDEFNAATAAEYPDYKAHVVENYENSLAGNLVKLFSYTAPASSEYGTDVGLVRDEYIVKVITCAPDEFDGLWEEFMAKAKDAGIQNILDERIAHFTNK